MNIRLKKILKTLNKHSPSLLTAGAILSTGAAIFSAYYDAIVAYERKQMKEESIGRKLTKKEIIKECWDCCLPTGIFFAGSVLCMVSSNRVYAKRQAALASAYLLLETGFKEYKDEVIKTIGKRKEKKISEDSYKIESKPREVHNIIDTGRGNVLFKDTYTGRYFLSDIQYVRKIENELNKALLFEMFIPLNEVYYNLGLETVDSGEILGWNISDGLIEFELVAKLTETDEPCIVLGYNIRPRADYYNL